MSFISRSYNFQRSSGFAQLQNITSLSAILYEDPIQITANANEVGTINWPEILATTPGPICSLPIVVEAVANPQILHVTRQRAVELVELVQKAPFIEHLCLIEAVIWKVGDWSREIAKLSEQGQRFLDFQKHLEAVESLPSLLVKLWGCLSSEKEPWPSDELRSKCHDWRAEIVASLKISTRFLQIVPIPFQATCNPKISAENKKKIESNRQEILSQLNAQITQLTQLMLWLINLFEHPGDNHWLISANLRQVVPYPNAVNYLACENLRKTIQSVENSTAKTQIGFIGSKKLDNQLNAMNRACLNACLKPSAQHQQKAAASILECVCEWMALKNTLSALQSAQKRLQESTMSVAECIENVPILINQVNRSREDVLWYAHLQAQDITVMEKWVKSSIKMAFRLMNAGSLKLMVHPTNRSTLEGFFDLWLALHASDESVDSQLRAPSPQSPELHFLDTTQAVDPWLRGCIDNFEAECANLRLDALTHLISNIRNKLKLQPIDCSDIELALDHLVDWGEVYWLIQWIKLKIESSDALYLRTFQPMQEHISKENITLEQLDSYSKSFHECFLGPNHARMWMATQMLKCFDHLFEAVNDDTATTFEFSIGDERWSEFFNSLRSKVIKQQKAKQKEYNSIPESLLEEQRMAGCLSSEKEPEVVQDTLPLPSNEAQSDGIIRLQPSLISLLPQENEALPNTSTSEQPTSVSPVQSPKLRGEKKQQALERRKLRDPLRLIEYAREHFKYECTRITDSHHILEAEGKEQVSVPVHKGKELKRGILSDLLKTIEEQEGEL